MEWFNENAGIMVLLLSIVSVLCFACIITIVVNLKNRIAVQRLKMVGFYSRDAESRENYAEFTVGNRSLNDVGVKEIGLQNGKINLDFTAIYMQKANLTPGTRIVIDQRSSITFQLTEEELCSVLLESPKGKKLYRLRLYVVDLPGNVYYGSMHAVRKLLMEYIKRNNMQGTPVLPAETSANREQPATPAKEQPAAPADVPAADTAEREAEALSAVGASAPDGGNE